MRHGPVIDDQNNVYLLTVSGWVRKFDAQGNMRWAFRTKVIEGRLATPGALYQGSLYFASYGLGGVPSRGYLFSVSMESGEVNWRAYMPQGSTYDRVMLGCLVVHNGTILTALRDDVIAPAFGYNNKVLAFSAEDGAFLWDYRLNTPAALHSFQPSFPGDGTLLFSTPAARAFRLRLGDGSLVWKADFPEDSPWSLSGGGTLSPSGDVFFALGAYCQLQPFRDQAAPFPGVTPCSYGNCDLGPGLVVAYTVDDGDILWSRRFEDPLFGVSYPAVGYVKGHDSSPVLILGLGQPLDPVEMERGPTNLPSFLREWIAEGLETWPGLQNYVIEERSYPSAVWALNASNGYEVWRFSEPKWRRYSPAGEGEGFHRRERELSRGDTRRETRCTPDTWGSPVIGADGTVYVASGLSGALHAIRDEDGDGSIGEEEVSSFHTGQAFSNGPALGRGILAAAPCWGPMYVFG